MLCTAPHSAACRRVGAATARLTELRAQESEQRRLIADGEAVLAKVVQEIELVEAELEAAVTAPVAADEDPTLWLPDELMLNILLHVVYIGSCASVCRRWHAICQDTVVKEQRWALRWGDYAAGKLNPTVHQLGSRERSPQAVALSPDEQRVYFTTEREGRDYVTALEVRPRRAGGKPVSATFSDECRQEWFGHTAPIAAIAVGVDGTVYTGAQDNTIVVWSPSGDPLNTLREHTDWVRALAVSPCGTLFSGSDDTTVIQWDLSTDPACIKKVRTLQSHTSYIFALALDTQGRVFSGSEDATIRAWSVGDGAEVAVLRYHGNTVSSLATHAGTLVSGSFDKMIAVWSLDTLTLITVLTAYTTVRNVGMSARGELFAVGDDMSLRVWPRPLGESGEVLVRFRCGVLPKIALAVTSTGVVFTDSSDGGVVAW